ncbi:LysR family transcriptional regulator [Lichenibacterium dinghuense]|uniref:LysR family transcriptional regulator n=1 Tax=Lichenibacterium dinghuense TaxID=2895977 RepID=UPI001F2B5E6E|nr:LysR family transcriptional regulator [Lichenibacterium sp. 6Y81]
MDWDDVRVFLAVARAGQFVAAARALKIDHATAARRVSALERALNARLVERRTTGVLLTEAGARFLAAAERMETACLQAQAELGDRDVELSGTVRIGAPDGLSTYYLAALFAALAERHPAIAIQLVPTPQAGPVGRRDVDIAVVLEKPEAGRFVSRKLTDYSLGLFASAGYLARHPAPADAAGLRAHRLVGYVEEFNYSPALGYVAELCGDAPVAFQCAGAVGQLEAVRAGIGIGVLHDFIARRHPDLVRVLPARRAERSYWIVEHEDTRGIGRIRAVHDALVEAATRDRATFMAR